MAALHTKILVFGLMLRTISGSAIPIWDLLNYEEKMGRLTYILVHLVGQYCKDSHIPDCQKNLVLYGMSNLMNKDKDSLDVLDPYQKDGHQLVWKAALKSGFKMPPKIPKGISQTVEDVLLGLREFTEESEMSKLILSTPLR
ncbi:rhythmically expressed gene 5 protein-like [Limulus polyphemus]|uniref:Rhythmically expressed gene 5 protein-like n=1 Tax=Limulus polyphemus TaxID=6850 RepID=A0ABM1TGQ4_LIMPO|nr:rhythmically expressed gene 5 protein-like [Limulus polyphemus]